METVRAIRLVWDSLDSHLEASQKSPSKKCCARAVGSKKFHKKCCQEYLEVLKVLVDKL